MIRSPDDWVMSYSVLGSKEMVLSLETLTSNQAKDISCLPRASPMMAKMTAIRLKNLSGR